MLQNDERTEIPGLVCTYEVGAFESASLCFIIQGKDYVVKSKINYVSKEPPKYIQERFLKDYKDAMVDDIVQSKEMWKKYPLATVPVDQIIKECKRIKINFIDPEFPPTMASIEGHRGYKANIDSAIQWRRPKDFMKFDP